MTYTGPERRTRRRDDPHYAAAAQAIYEKWLSSQPPLNRRQQVIAARLRRRLGIAAELPGREDYELAAELSTDEARLLAVTRERMSRDEASEVERLAQMFGEHLESRKPQ